MLFEASYSAAGAGVVLYLFKSQVGRMRYLPKNKNDTTQVTQGDVSTFDEPSEKLRKPASEAAVTVKNKAIRGESPEIARKSGINPPPISATASGKAA